MYKQAQFNKSNKHDKEKHGMLPFRVTVPTPKTRIW